MEQVEEEYIKNLRAIAGVSGNVVTLSDLSILYVKYKLMENDWDKMVNYCKDHFIYVCNFIEKNTSSDDTDTLLEKIDEVASAEQKEREELAEIITEKVMHYAAIKAKKRVDGRGWLCGTYMSSIGRLINMKVKAVFSTKQMEYIVSHLSEETEGKEQFEIHSEDLKKYKCWLLNKTLNLLIPRLRINRFYQDFFDA